MHWRSQLALEPPIMHESLDVVGIEPQQLAGFTRGQEFVGHGSPLPVRRRLTQRDDWKKICPAALVIAAASVDPDPCQRSPSFSYSAKYLPDSSRVRAAKVAPTFSINL